MKSLIVMFAIAILLLLLALRAEAQEGARELTVTLKVTNTKTGTVHTRAWDLDSYTFQDKIPINVPDFKVKKIKSIFGSNTFTFTLNNKAFEGHWLHFDVELSGTIVVGKGLSVRFV